MVRECTQHDVASCAQVLASLPEWFGIEDVNRQTIRDLEVLPSAVAVHDDEVVGFVSIRDHGFGSAEIEVESFSGTVAIRPREAGAI